MKKFLMLALLWATTWLNAQNFEGKITYSNIYKSKVAQVSDQQWTAMLGNTQEYEIKGGNYRSDTNGTMMQWILFLNKDNKLYSKLSTSETVFFSDVTVQGDEVTQSELKKGALTILGFLCDELTLTCTSGVQRYYFNSKFGVDPKLFVNHKLGNWYDFISKSKALPLKTIIETKQFTIESTALKITPMQLEASRFALPAGTKTEKSPF